MGAVGLLGLWPAGASAQKSVADVLGRPATSEGQPKAYLEELMLFSYVENSYVVKFGKQGHGNAYGNAPNATPFLLDPTTGQPIGG